MYSGTVVTDVAYTVKADDEEQAEVFIADCFEEDYEIFDTYKVINIKEIKEVK